MWIKKKPLEEDAQRTVSERHRRPIKSPLFNWGGRIDGQARERSPSRAPSLCLKRRDGDDFNQFALKLAGLICPEAEQLLRGINQLAIATSINPPENQILSHS